MIDIVVIETAITQADLVRNSRVINFIISFLYPALKIEPLSGVSKCYSFINFFYELAYFI